MLPEILLLDRSRQLKAGGRETILAAEKMSAESLLCARFREVSDGSATV